MGCSDRVQCAKGGVLLWRDVDEAVTTRRYGRRGFFVNVAASSSVHFCLRLHSCPYLETIFVCVCVCVMTIAITVRPLRGDRWLHFHTPWSVESFDRRRSIHFDSATPGHASFRSLFLLYFLGFLSFFFSAKIRRCLATDLALVASRIGYGSHGFIIIIIIFKYRKHQKSKRNGGRTIPSLAKEWP